ncbi:hypothetical protein MRBBS_0125 [Marinobacter sp. BSs20148]|nr:hypothetical protein MRBBS_0125 [Marinobacter sp. BSs20148]
MTKPARSKLCTVKKAGNPGLFLCPDFVSETTTLKRSLAPALKNTAVAQHFL